MKNSTPCYEREPSELTLHIIRTVAHNFPVTGQLNGGPSLAWN